MDFRAPPPEPELILTTLPDGCIHLAFGTFTGVVTSHHLVPTKAAQLRTAWLLQHTSHG